jgi:hypothetical protein
VEDVYQNAARQIYDGVDISGSYSFGFAGGVMVASGSASWLEGTQQSTPTSASFNIVGTIYYPTHWRSRGGLLWSSNGWSVSTNVNYVGSEIDNRTAINRNVASQTTTDLALGYKYPEMQGPLKNVQVLVSVLNLFDAVPPYVKSTISYSAPFDSTNYSTIGRLVSVSISKHF